ncbi:hypothetical protein CAPTEDRAFT_216405 [Capitella teleta]|uniref:Uncharacterized protein n=1 Tax=Capitella teleta TaxID=283909 RepID=R7U4U9_CAPTE|nr:hypothetical protein CAPTEDRAFT_216405 [Capitella teleta]|eukprot:ELU00964.1 hypothetical protein CAPTEDRAFT_216405 [Capitella teleta]
MAITSQCMLARLRLEPVRKKKQDTLPAETFKVAVSNNEERQKDGWNCGIFTLEFLTKDIGEPYRDHESLLPPLKGRLTLSKLLYEHSGANVDNANQWIVLWNPVVSKLNEMRPDPPARIAHTSIFADLCLKLHVLEVAHVYYQTQCGNLAQSRINNARYRYVAYRQFVMWIMDILLTWKKYPCTAVILCLHEDPGNLPVPRILWF